jgi:hypothetical protein
LIRQSHYQQGALAWGGQVDPSLGEMYSVLQSRNIFEQKKMQDRLKWIVVLFREAQNCRDKKTIFFFDFLVFDFLFSFLVLSGKLGKQSSRFRGAITFCFWQYCLFVPGQKSSESYHAQETILCFSEL